MQSFKLEDLKCFKIYINDPVKGPLKEDKRSFEIWADKYDMDEFDYIFKIKDAWIAQISKEIVLNIEEV